MRVIQREHGGRRILSCCILGEKILRRAQDDKGIDAIATISLPFRANTICILIFCLLVGIINMTKTDRRQ